MPGENYHHGAEFFEITVGNEIVTDIKAAVTLLIGTAPVHVANATPATRAPFIQNMTIVRRKSDALPFGPATAGYTIPEALAAAFNKSKDKGIGTYIVVNVFDPDKHKDANGAPDPTKVTAADIIGGLDLAGRPFGLDLAYACYSRFGFFPRRVIAPRFCGLTGVRQKMQVVANKIKGQTLWDMTPGMTKQAALESRGVNGTFNVADERVALLYPQLMALDPITGDQSLQPYSQHFAAVWNQLCSAEGPHVSPSNKPMIDVSGTDTDIYFLPGAYDTDTNLLNEAGIITTMTSFATGINTYGASSAAWPSVHSATSWLHGRAVMDVIEDTILTYAMPMVDRIASPQMIDALEERVRAWLRTKERDGWIYGSRFNFNREKTTAEEFTATGRLWWKLETLPVGLAHRLSFEGSTDTAFAKTALGLLS